MTKGLEKSGRRIVGDFVRLRPGHIITDRAGNDVAVVVAVARTKIDKAGKPVRHRLTFLVEDL